MPLPVIADGYQATLVWTNPAAQRPATNRLFFRDIPGTQTEANLFADLDSAVTAAMWSYGVTTSRIQSVNITKLDGVSAGQSFSTAINAKWAGGNTGHFIPQAAVVVSLKSAQRGPRGRNRIYLPWVAEAAVDDGALQTVNVTGMTTAWTTFQSAMIVAGWQPIQVSNQYDIGLDIASTVVRQPVKTQRRRARR